MGRMSLSVVFCVLVYAQFAPIQGTTFDCVNGQTITITDNSGRLRSPNYPNNYPNNWNCYVKILPSNGQVLSGDFTSFELQGPSSWGNCYKDYVVAYDGSSYFSPKVYHGYNGNGRVCGTTIPSSFTTSGPALFIRFKSNSNTNRPGFLFNWSTVSGGSSSSDSDPCDGTARILTDSSGTVTSPGFPSYYDHNLQCAWRIEAPAGKRVQLHFDVLLIEPAASCEFDDVSIYDGDSNIAPRIGDKLCGSSAPSDIQSTGDSIYLEFSTDYSVSWYGFQLQYTIIDGSSSGSTSTTTTSTTSTTSTSTTSTTTSTTTPTTTSTTTPTTTSTTTPTTTSTTPSTTTSTTTTTTTTTTTPAPSDDGVTSADCNFEQGLCTWTQVTTDTFDWSINNGGTPSGGTGPNSGHTSGSSSDKYVYIETSNPRNEGDSARLVSPKFRSVPSSGRCMRFYYHMNGGGMGHLRIYKQYTNGDEELIWHRDGDQGNYWRAASINLSGNQAFYLIIEGDVGTNYQGDASVDDISFDEQACLAVPLDCGVNNLARMTRIMGGEASSSGEWPWQVQLRTTIPGSSSFMQCGGSIISDQWVLTASHCVELEDSNLRITDPNYLRLYFGELNLNNYEASEFAVTPELVIPHPQRSAFGVGPHDILLIKLSAPLTFSEHVNQVCLPSPSDYVGPGAQCVVSGWGVENYQGSTASQLMHVDQEIFSLTTCSQSYGSSTVQNGMVCAGNLQEMDSACQGDSGGPLVCQQTSGQYVLAGVVSFGAPCGYYSQALPGVYAGVEYYLSWIESTIQGN